MQPRIMEEILKSVPIENISEGADTITPNSAADI